MTSDLPTDELMDETHARLQKALEGSIEAQGWLAQTFSPYLLVVARRRHQPNHASIRDPEDMVQETWVHAWPKLETVEARDGASFERSLLRYLSTVLINLYNDLGRRSLSGTTPKVRLDQPGNQDRSALLAETSGVVTKTCRSERAAQLHAALEKLDPLDRDVIVMRMLEQQSVQVTALALDVTPATVVNRLRRALPKLRGILPDSLADGQGDA